MQINVMSTEQGTNMKKNDDDPRNAKRSKGKKQANRTPLSHPQWMITGNFGVLYIEISTLLNSKPVRSYWIKKENFVKVVMPFRARLLKERVNEEVERKRKDKHKVRMKMCGKKRKIPQKKELYRALSPPPNVNHFPWCYSPRVP